MTPGPLDGDHFTFGREVETVFSNNPMMFSLFPQPAPPPPPTSNYIPSTCVAYSSLVMIQADSCRVIFVSWLYVQQKDFVAECGLEPGTTLSLTSEGKCDTHHATD